MVSTLYHQVRVQISVEPILQKPLSIFLAILFISEECTKVYIRGGEMRNALVFHNYLYQQHLLLICNGKNNSFLRFL